MAARKLAFSDGEVSNDTYTAGDLKRKNKKLLAAAALTDESNWMAL